MKTVQPSSATRQPTATKPFIASFVHQFFGMPPSKRPLIVALTGDTGAGKDTVAGILAPQQGFCAIAFADALRREVAEAWRIDVRMLIERATKELPLPALAAGMCGLPAFIHWCATCGENLAEPRSPRWVMQRWADFQRRFDPAYYTRIAERWIARQVGIGWSRVVVSDLRYPVEEDALRRMGAKVVRIVVPKGAGRMEQSTAGHSSEQHHRIQADHTIVNDGTLQQLAARTLACVAELELEAKAQR